MIDPVELSSRDFYSELNFTTSRSSGPGGQHVNKLETRVTLHFIVYASQVLNEEERGLLLKKWEKKLTKEGALVLSAEKHRSQLRNKEEVVKKFRNELRLAFTKPKSRRPTKPTKASVRRRKDDKKKNAQKKSMRKPPERD